MFLEVLERNMLAQKSWDFNITCLENNYDYISDWEMNEPEEFQELKLRFSYFSNTFILHFFDCDLKWL